MNKLRLRHGHQRLQRRCWCPSTRWRCDPRTLACLPGCTRSAHTREASARRGCPTPWRAPDGLKFGFLFGVGFSVLFVYHPVSDVCWLIGLSLLLRGFFIFAKKRKAFLSVFFDRQCPATAQFVERATSFLVSRDFDSPDFLPSSGDHATQLHFLFIDMDTLSLIHI